TRDQTNVLRVLLLADVLDPEGRPVPKRLRSLVRSQVEVAADAMAVADQRNRGRSRICADRPPDPWVCDAGRAGRKPGEPPPVGRGLWPQPAKRLHLTVDGHASAGAAAQNTDDRGDGPGDCKQPPQTVERPVKYFHRRRSDRRC